MPGSNDFSMAPDIMEPAYDTPSSSTPTLTRRSTPATPKMTSIVGEATVQKPKGIATRPTNVGNLGDPYTNLPKVYTRGNFEQVALKQKYGEDASWWDKQKFKSYLKSDQGIADKNKYIASENEKELKSYQDYVRALSAQSKERMLAAKRKFDVAVAKFDQPVEETQPPTAPATPVKPVTPVTPVKPAVTPRSNAEWNRIAKDNGFADMGEVLAWQEANGLTADGKFGKASAAFFKSNGLGKYQKTPEGFVELSRQDGTTFLQRTPTSTTPAQKQGGTMNRINYFQQGGAAPQQDMQQQVIALVQAAMNGDQKATETVNKIMEAAKAGDQQAMQIAQMIQQVAQKMQGQATAAKWGSKLSYIKSLKFAKGGKACPECEKGAPIVEKKACGGKKAKKRYFGGLI